MNHGRRLRMLAAVLPLALGCSSGEKPIEIGETRTGEKLSDYSAQWEGYAEGHSFWDGTDRVRLALHEDGTGALVFGNDGPAITAPMDPEVWPEWATPLSGQVGFSYPVTDAMVEHRRIRASVDFLVLARPWCEMQSSHFANGNYQCVPNVGYWRDEQDHCFLGAPPDVSQPVDCGKVQACNFGVCNCAADGCTAPGPYRDIDLAWVNEDALEGGVGLFDNSSSPITVRLYRVD